MTRNKKIKEPAGNQSQEKGRFADPSLRKVVSYDDCHPVFCLKYLQDNYGLDSCSRDEQASFAKALRKRSSMTWREIWAANRHGLGAEKINRNSIKAPIPRDITEDVDFFVAIRFCGRAPMVGYRIKDVFRIVWLDSKFEVYPH